MAIDLLGPASDQSATTRPGRIINRLTADTWFKDCTDPDANDGTALGADFLNDSLAQLRTALRSSGIVLDNADDMLWRAMQSVGLRYGEDTGTANHLIVTFAPVVASLYAGLAVLVKVNVDPTGAVDFTPNELATKAVTWPDGTAIAGPADFKAGTILLLVYDGTQWQLIFKLNNTAAGGGTGAFVPGCIYGWPLATAPDGTLECDGAAVDRTVYARLFALIGTTYGSGNGTTTFNLPDYRGEFLRGWDHGKGSDPNAAARTNRGDGQTGDKVGTKQADVYKAHGHDISNAGIAVDSVANGTGEGGIAVPVNAVGTNRYPLRDITSGNALTNTSTTATPPGGSETRPRNVNILYVIAW